MFRRIIFLAWCAAAVACVESSPEPQTDSAVAALQVPTAVAVEHAAVRGDVGHTTYTLTLGATPNARIRVHRVVRERRSSHPRPTRGAIMLMHGDFSSFATNFAPITRDPAATPGLAVWLAEQGFDVWGIDRRWAVTAADGDISDYADLGLVQELDDTDLGLAWARTVRWFGGAGAGPIHLAGFSRGGLIAYAAAARDAVRPAVLRSVRGLVVLDVWAAIPPERTDVIAATCEGAAFEYQLVAEGFTDAENSFFIEVGELALSAPDETSPNPRFTNRQRLYRVAAQTYRLFAPTSFYHLASGQLDDTGTVVALRDSPEPVIANWFATATPHQSMIESADTDAVWCGDGSAPIELDLAAIQVPVLYLGAAGGYGDDGVYSTTLVSSHDVTTRVVRRFPLGGELEDFGHGDLLFATDAPALAWQPLAQWLAAR